MREPSASYFPLWEVEFLTTQNRINVNKFITFFSIWFFIFFFIYNYTILFIFNYIRLFFFNNFIYQPLVTLGMTSVKIFLLLNSISLHISFFGLLVVSPAIPLIDWLAICLANYPIWFSRFFLESSLFLVIPQILTTFFYFYPFYSYFKSRVISSFQTKFRQRGILKYLILVLEGTF